MNKHKFTDEKDDTELWFISLADLMSLLMVFFVLLYSMSTLEAKKIQELGQSLSSRFVSKEEDTSLFKSTVDEPKREQRALQMLVTLLNLNDESNALDKIEEVYAKANEKDNITENVKQQIKKLNALKAEVKGDDKKAEDIILEVVFDNDHVFDTHNEVRKEALDGFRDFINSIKPLVASIDLEVLSFTDSRTPTPDTGFQNNWELSTERATKVAKTLIKLGVEGDKVSVKGMGAKQPILPNFNPDGKANYENMKKNNRTTILLKKPQYDYRDF